MTALRGVHLILACRLAAGAFVDGVQEAPPAERCTLAAEDRRWIQAGLDGWERASRELLHISPDPLPWIVLVKRPCAYHLGADQAMLPDTAQRLGVEMRFLGRPAPVYGVPNSPDVWLPSGDRVDAGPFARTSLYADGTRPFFALAMLDIWREDPKAAARSNLDQFFLGVTIHELVHTRQLVAVSRRIEALRARGSFPEDLNDDIIEERFKDVPGFRDMYLAERNAFYAASAARGDDECRQLTRHALDLAAARRARFFTAEQAVYADLEDLFLSMEGLAVWTHWRLSETDPRIGFEHAGNTSWSQDEGLVLFRLIERLIPAWRERMFDGAPPAPFRVLEAELGR